MKYLPAHIVLIIALSLPAYPQPVSASGPATIKFPDRLYYRTVAILSYNATEIMIDEMGIMRMKKASIRKPRIETGVRRLNPTCWQTFLDETESLNILKWKESYHAPYLDGYQWEFALKMDGVTLKSRGRNAGPDPVNPQETMDRGKSGNWLLKEALLRLWETADEIDITDRAQTDPLLRIRTDRSLLPANDGLFTVVDPMDVEIQTNRIRPSYKQMWGKNDVLMVHPISKAKHGGIDFSEVTSNHSGIMNLYVKNDPRGNHDIRILKDGELIGSQSIGKNRWEHIKIEFNHQAVELQVHASGWQYEFSFITYEITEEKPDSGTSPGHAGEPGQALR